jgi:hypothetical protein
MATAALPIKMPVLMIASSGFVDKVARQSRMRWNVPKPACTRRRPAGDGGRRAETGRRGHCGWPIRKGNPLGRRTVPAKEKPAGHGGRRRLGGRPAKGPSRPDNAHADAAFQ